MKIGLTKLRAVLLWSLVVVGLFELFQVISFAIPNKVYVVPHEPYLAVVAPASKVTSSAMNATWKHVVADIISVWRYGV